MIDGVWVTDPQLIWGGAQSVLTLLGHDVRLSRYGDQLIFTAVDDSGLSTEVVEDLLLSARFWHPGEITSTKDYRVSLSQIIDTGKDEQIGRSGSGWSYDSSKHSNQTDFTNSGSGDNRLNHALVQVENNRAPFIEPEVPFYRSGPGQDIVINGVDFDEPEDHAMNVVVQVSGDGTPYGTFNVNQSLLGSVPASSDERVNEQRRAEHYASIWFDLRRRHGAEPRRSCQFGSDDFVYGYGSIWQVRLHVAGHGHCRS
jgi:hypothetical protein